MVLVLADAAILTRVCTECGVEKPLSEFDVTYTWHYRRCKQCRSTINKAYNLRTSENRKARYKKNKAVLNQQDRDRHQREREHNLELYGTTTSPEDRARALSYYYERGGREKSAARRDDAHRQRERDYYKIVVGPKRLERFGKTQSPEWFAQEKDRRAKLAAETGYATTQRHRTYTKAHFLELRAKVIELYGGKCECCGVNEYALLTIDHKSGKKDDKRMHGVRLVYDALNVFQQFGYPNDKYQLLCWNCNMSEGFYGYCPHNEPRSVVHEHTMSCNWGTKLEMVDAYGGKCVICGESMPEFLTIDHANGGGTKHRKQVGGDFRAWLRRQGWPKEGYRLLCANCNCSVKTNKWTNRNKSGTEVKS
jgi:hypothetical protein